MLLGEALNARGSPPTNATSYPADKNPREDPNGERALNQNPINQDMRYNPNRATKVNNNQLSFSKENGDSYDEEYEIEPNSYEQRGSYTRSITPSIREEQH